MDSLRAGIAKLTPRGKKRQQPQQQQQQTCPDSCQLVELTEDSVLDNLRQRYEQKSTRYTWTRSILLAVNPYETLPIYGEATMARCPNRPLSQQEPHASTHPT